MRIPNLRHTRIFAAFRASFIGRNAIPSLALLFALPCSMTASANTEIFNTAGTTEWLCPPGVTSVTVEVWGGGGAGGGAFIDGGSANAGGGGGGGGAYARLDSVPVTPGNTYTITIPAAAASPVSGFLHNARYDGAAVSFTGDDDVTITANGGQGGECTIVTGGTAISGQPGVGGAISESHDAEWAGGNATFWGAGNGGGGGGGAGDLGNGGSPLASSGSSGAGGDGSDADHTGGNGGNSRNGAGTGNNAASPGGGGAGAKSTPVSAGSKRGGNGGLGRIILTYTIPPPASVTKANNTDDLALGSSWVGGVAPGSLDLAKWDGTVTSANATVLGADATWSGIVIENPAGLVTIGGTNTLTLGAAIIDLDLSTATADLTVNSPLVMSGDHVWDVADSRILTIGGTVSGDFPLTMQGGGTVKLGVGDVLPSGAGNGNVTVDTTLDLNGNSATINGLSGNGIVDTAAASAAATLTVGGNNQGGTFNGILQNTGSSATLNLVKTGTGTLVLGGANTLSGAVSVTGGRLAFSNTAPFDNISGMAMSAGTTLRPDVVSGAIGAPITLGGADTTVTINAPSIVGAGGTSPVPLTLNGAISGAGNLAMVGIQTTNAYGTIILNAASDYEGSTLIHSTASNSNAQIFVRLGIENALPVTTVLTLDGGDGTGSDRYCQLDLKGFNQTLAGLTNNPAVNSARKQQIINSTGGTPATLTINNSDDYEFSGRLGTTSGQTGSVGVNFALTKTGAGTLSLSGNNNYTGATTITGGTLALGASTALPGSSAVSIGAATLDIGAAVSASTLGTLEVTGAATIDLGTGAALTFADSSDSSWSGTLTITGNFVSGASLRFGTDANGLISGQLAAISGPGLSDIAINSEGYLTATVAASGYSTWAATNAGGQGPELDFDGDGVANGIEFFLNAPSGFTAMPALDGSNTITWANGGNIPASDYGSQFVVQTSSDLLDWTDVPIGEILTNTDGPAGTLSYTLDGTAPRFVRLKVTPTL